ncbi:cAMP-dependent protein kinase type 2 [Zancudomyces culisetae]|uniref:cAMP-dependent protein kinase n=1 Tax=Zancudomyces culisetae TaxID=1213189 RepID=A0A1R1PV16_ZANCU|nr:cAMP-dependent protein kinase type 2 [Zancudomyces culisetae]|eukprot:OMH84825.1 cAMP-dependent protein kinase type 2 [Zancudomyces culisetae]
MGQGISSGTKQSIGVRKSLECAMQNNFNNVRNTEGDTDNAQRKAHSLNPTARSDPCREADADAKTLVEKQEETSPCQPQDSCAARIPLFCCCTDTQTQAYTSGSLPGRGPDGTAEIYDPELLAKERRLKYLHFLREKDRYNVKLKLSDFEFYRTIGAGSFGKVKICKYLKAGDLKPKGRKKSGLGKAYYACKILTKSEVLRSNQVEHVINERNVLQFVECPFIVKIFGTAQDQNNLYMFLEYIVGGELFSYLRKYESFPSPVAKFYAAEVFVAFEYLHSYDLVYRDLKPENILVDRTGHIKITDLGFSKHVPENITWTLCGTPDYLAPEIIANKGYGKAVDWYSLGVLIFEMIAGYTPFYESDHYKMYERILANRIQWPSVFDPDAKDLVRKLVTPDLSKRYGNLSNGPKDISRHKWFREVDWQKLMDREIAPPLVPTQSVNEGDTSNFDEYGETEKAYIGTDQEYEKREEFVDF